MQNIAFALTDIQQTIDDCIKKKRGLPATILLYSSVDIFGWLASEKKVGVRVSFESFVNEYMLKKTLLPCTATELYGARCSVLHTLTARSEIHKKATPPREIYYAIRPARIEILKASIRRNKRRAVAVYLDDIFEAFILGAASFLSEVDANTPRGKEVARKARQVFSFVPNLSKGRS